VRRTGARRNDSLGARGRRRVFAFLFAVSIGIAGGFAYAGAWPVLPYAGVEMLVLYCAFRWMDRHAGDYERITITDGRVEIEVREAGQCRREALSRYWARVVNREGGTLALRSHGREIEIGRHLDEEQRRALAREIGSRLGAAGR
jgi:uncharacterized membrane protein